MLIARRFHDDDSGSVIGQPNGKHLAPNARAARGLAFQIAARTHGGHEDAAHEANGARIRSC